MTPEQQEAIWVFCTSVKPWPTGFTAKRLEKVKPIIMRWPKFWMDMEAHVGQGTPEQLNRVDPAACEHMVGNFVGMVMEALWKSGILQ